MYRTRLENMFAIPVSFSQLATKGTACIGVIFKCRLDTAHRTGQNRQGRCVSCHLIKCLEPRRDDWTFCSVKRICFLCKALEVGRFYVNMVFERVLFMVREKKFLQSCKFTRSGKSTGVHPPMVPVKASEAHRKAVAPIQCFRGTSTTT